mmetsp:Transcript_3988/g.6296  ORF Transcript_3988/g.6296 Transcript_3988/m.6296 type:complete len:270 (+) Transcript_3988:893-1702(+)
MRRCLTDPIIIISSSSSSSRIHSSIPSSSSCCCFFCCRCSSRRFFSLSCRSFFSLAFLSLSRLSRSSSSSSSSCNGTSESSSLHIVEFKPGKIGFQFKGRLVTKVEEGFQAHKHGIQPGWRLSTIDQKPAPEATAEIIKSIRSIFSSNKNVIVGFQKQNSSSSSSSSGGLTGAAATDSTTASTDMFTMPKGSTKWTPVRNAAKRSAKFKSMFAMVVFMGCIVAVCGYFYYQSTRTFSVDVASSPRENIRMNDRAGPYGGRRKKRRGKDN